MNKRDLAKIARIHHWQYQLVLMDVSHPKEPWYELHEVHVDKKGKVVLWTGNCEKVDGETPQEVLHGLLLMAIDAQRYPALKESELPGGKKS